MNNKILILAFFIGAIVYTSSSDNVPSYKTNCTLLNGTITVIVNYTKNENRRSTVTYEFSPNATANGLCPKGDQLKDPIQHATFNLKENGTVLTFELLQNTGKTNTAVDQGHWGVTKMTFKYELQQADEKIQGKREAISNGSFFNAPVNRTYSCSKDKIAFESVLLVVNATSKRNISDNETVVFNEKGMGFIYFNTTKAPNSGEYDNYYCKADQKVADVVPIIVGCALAALVVIVLVAYLIGRRRAVAPGGYERV